MTSMKDKRTKPDDIEVIIKGKTYFQDREDWLYERQRKMEFESQKQQVESYLSRKKGRK